MGWAGCRVARRGNRDRSLAVGRAGRPRDMRPIIIPALVVMSGLAASTSIACARGRSDVVRPATHLAEPRASHTTTPLDDGRLLVVGGFRKGPDGHSQLYAATTEIIDPARRTVIAGPRLRHARAGHAALPLVDGRILVVGGWNDEGMMRSAEIYDPRTGAFAAAGELHEPRGGVAAVRLADGRVLVCGGGEARATRSAEVFDPADGRFHATGAMGAPRLGHSATLLADGRVLVAGGASGRDEVIASAELYDPADGTFTPAASLAVARYKHAATRLADGRVLLVGGADARDWKGRHDTTELYDPTTDRFASGPALTSPRFKLPGALVALGDAVAVAGGGATVELVRPDHASRTIARLGRASFFGTATAVGERLVIVGGYDERLRVTTGVWIVPTTGR